MNAWLYIGGVTLCALAAIVAIRKIPTSSQPVRLPEPGGVWPIGVTTLSLDDPKRSRPIVARVWYPRAPGHCTKSAPFDPFPAQTPTGGFAAVLTHDSPDAAPEPGPWPVIIYSPGWDGGCSQNTSLCEMLASSGFVVFALNHAGGSPFVKMPGGQIWTNEHLEHFDLSTAASSAAFFEAAERELELRSGDVRFMIDSLQALNAGELAQGLFQNKLDTSHLGVAGFSFGGAVAAEVCLTDPRVRAGVNLDGSLFGRTRRSPAKQPFLFLTDNLPPPSDRDLQSPDQAVRRNAVFLAESNQDFEFWQENSGAWIIRIDDIGHPDFTDQALRSGKDQRARLVRINSSVTRFFESSLLGKHPDLFKDPSGLWASTRKVDF